ncbi:MAG: CDP-glycerol glycerophosphotransferase family protein [Clostridia bacterium]|nr:CDP-glycerol glycerophosphotransferase family protein [Clostridia bacterium]
MSVKSMIKKSKAVYRAVKAAGEAPHALARALMRAFHGRCGISADTVYFSSFNGMQYNDNPRYVAEALHELRPSAKLVFRLNGKAMRDPRVPDYIEKVPRYSLRALKVMATARVLVKNAGMLPWMAKFPDQFYVQTWHGDRGFKRIRLDRKKSRQFEREAEWLDLMTSGSDFGSRVNRSAFGYRGENLECGCPRNDLLVRGDPYIAARVREELGIPKGTRVLLYAPTFRSKQTGDSQEAGADLEKVRARLEQTTGQKWLCVTRSHELNSGVRSNAAMDASDYPETSELLLATDMLITDYSSIGGDFMLLNRPVIYFQPDRGDYDAERGLYFDPDQSPLIVAHDEQELLDILSKPIDAAANCRAVLDFFGVHESGRAARTVAERIAKVLDEKR